MEVLLLHFMHCWLFYSGRKAGALMTGTAVKPSPLGLFHLRGSRRRAASCSWSELRMWERVRTSCFSRCLFSIHLLLLIIIRAHRSAASADGDLPPCDEVRFCLIWSTTVVLTFTSTDIYFYCCFNLKTHDTYACKKPTDKYLDFNLFKASIVTQVLMSVKCFSMTINSPHVPRRRGLLASDAPESPNSRRCQSERIPAAQKMRRRKATVYWGDVTLKIPCSSSNWKTSEICWELWPVASITALHLKPATPAETYGRDLVSFYSVQLCCCFLIPTFLI